MRDTYYWADGRKVPLEASTDVVIDVDSEAGAQLAESERGALRETGHSLSSSLVMVPEDEAAAALGADGPSGPGVHPVFRSEDGTRIVVLPEVRVESSDPEQLEAVRRSLKSAEVVDEDDERLVLAPTSGRGEDALELANTLAEKYDLDVVQARFLRIVARPEPGQPDRG